MRNMRRASSSSFTVRKVDEFFIENMLTPGDFSNVYEGTHSITRQHIAMKIISKKKMAKMENGNEIIFAETKIFPYLQHPHIAKQLKCFENINSYFQVMEFYSTNLLEFITLKKPSYQQKLQILDQILSAIEYLHMHNICHRDIKLDNILMNDEDDVFLSDFGFATFAYQPVTGFLGSCGYCAPEVLKKNKTYDGICADLWSTGVLIYALFAERLPFEHTRDPSKLNPLNIDYSKLPQEIEHIVRQLLVVEPKLRSSISTIRDSEVFRGMQDRYFNNFDMSDYSNKSTLLIVSEIFGSSNIEKDIEESGMNPEKIMFNIVNDQVNEVIQPFYVSLSCPLPHIDIPYDYSIISEESYKINLNHCDAINLIRSHFISHNFTVSMTKNGQIIAIRNALENDTTLTIEIMNENEDDDFTTVRIFGNDPDSIKLFGNTLAELQKF